jgi:hypothetical protein
MAALNRGISAHLSELDRQQRAITTLPLLNRHVRRSMMRSGQLQPRTACLTSASANPSLQRFRRPSPPQLTRTSSRIGPAYSTNGTQLRRTSTRLGSLPKRIFSTPSPLSPPTALILSMPLYALPLQNSRQNGTPWSTRSHMPDGARLIPLRYRLLHHRPVLVWRHWRIPLPLLVPPRMFGRKFRPGASRLRQLLIRT